MRTPWRWHLSCAQDTIRGIERLILNVLGNPNIGFVVVCGADSHGAIGHLPGQSLVALTGSGVDDNATIIGAKAKRPVLQNLSREASP